MPNKKIFLITGGAGFIGSHTVDALIKKDYKVRVLDDLSGGNLSNLKMHSKSNLLDFEKGDVKKINTNNKLFKNVDYIIIKNSLWVLPEQYAKHGDHNKKLVLLTPDCFKMLCMRSKTKKADKVREYYIEIEKLIDKYKDIIIEENNKKIQKRNTVV